MSDSPAPGAPPGTAPPPVFLHIGAMKTGTTYLQNLLEDNKERLADQGFLFPGEPWAQQVRGVQDVLSLADKDPKVRAEAPGTWQALAHEMLRHEGSGSLISMEFLSFADAKAVRSVVASLSPADVHVVLTIRDATATIPAQWQTTVRSGQTISWPDFKKGVRTATGLRGRLGRFADPALVKFRRAQDIDRILKAWRRQVPARHLHVVTVPPSGSHPALLWERFAQAVGLDPEGFSQPESGANQSLGYASAELLRRVNVHLGQVHPTDYNATVREHLAVRVLSPRSAGETPARLDRETCEFGFEWNRRTRAAVLDTDADLWGDLGDLPTAMTATHEARIDDAQLPPTDAELLEVAETAAEAMRALVARRARRAGKRGIAVPAAQGEGSGTAPPARDGSPGPVSAAAGEIAALCRQAIELKQRLDAWCS